MQTIKNPFKPSAGTIPPILIGRDTALDFFEEGLEDGAGAPGLLSLITGSRGTGKTVLLRKAEKYAEDLGWGVLSSTATDNSFLEEIYDLAIEELTSKFSIKKILPQNLSLSALGVGIEYIREQKKSNLRTVLTELGDLYTKNDKGLLITVDEIQAIDQTSLQKLSAIRQHLVGKNINFALLVAGLPSLIEELIENDSSTSFLRRAERIQLGPVSKNLIQQAFDSTFRRNELILDSSTLKKMSEATQGYPFMIQLVGYHVWRKMVRSSEKFTPDIADKAIATAYSRLGDLVFAPELKEVSGIEKTILLRMSETEGPVKRKNLASSLNKTTTEISYHRDRLVKSGLIYSPKYGELDFVLPYLRSYIREHAVSQIE